MKRRNWLLLAGSALAGCNKGHKPTAEAPAKGGEAELGALKAGPFSVVVPEEWRTGAIVEKVPLKSLYTAEGWQAFQENEMNILKPFYACRPEHWAVRLPGALPKGIEFNTEDPGDDPTAPQILIHRADQWDVVYTDGKAQKGEKHFTPARLRQGMNGLLSGGREDPAGGGPRPTPAYMNASLDFACLPKRIEFDGGYGVRIVCEWQIEADLMTKGDLHYLFLGMSADDSCQIIASFPIDLSGLPESGEKAEHLGRSIARYDELTKDYEAYHKEAEEWLVQHQAEITPRLDLLDGMLRSLVVKTWA